MADHPHDSKEYRSLGARSVRAFDKVQGAVSTYFDHLSGYEGGGGLFKRGLIFGVAPTLVGTIVGLIMVPSGPSAPIDPDVSGNGLLNRTYAYQAYEAHNNTKYVLLRDQERYELYQYVHERSRIELVTDQAVARQIVEEMVRLTGTTLSGNTELFAKTVQTRVKMWQCDGLSEPVQSDTGIVYRTETSCDHVENTGSGLREQYTRANAFWSAALEHMSAENYGPQAASLRTLPPRDPEAFAPVSDMAKTGGLLGLGLWGGLAGLNAGAAGLRRRASNTQPGRRR